MLRRKTIYIKIYRGAFYSIIINQDMLVELPKKNKRTHL